MPPARVPAPTYLCVRRAKSTRCVHRLACGRPLPRRPRGSRSRIQQHVIRTRRRPPIIVRPLGGACCVVFTGLPKPLVPHRAYRPRAPMFAMGQVRLASTGRTGRDREGRHRSTRGGAADSCFARERQVALQRINAQSDLPRRSVAPSSACALPRLSSTSARQSPRRRTLSNALIAGANCPSALSAVPRSTSASARSGKSASIVSEHASASALRP